MLKTIRITILLCLLSAIPGYCLPPGKDVQKLMIPIRHTELLEFMSPVKRVSIADPAIADANVTSPRQIIVNGKTIGATTLIVWDENEQYYRYNVVVHSENSYNQVTLEVRFAEVSRTAFEEFGVNFLAKKINIGDEDVDIGGFAGQVNTPSDPLTLDDNVDFFLAVPTRNVSAIIRALEEKRLLTTLAKPNLSAISGSEASFLAGGEIPVPIVSGVMNQVTIQYKEFGIRLTFVPTVLDTGLVNLHVSTEVSSLDFENGLLLSGFRIPALISRKTETTVEMRDGEYFTIGGLVSSELANTATRIPYIGQIPILGKLFSSSRFQNSESELLIMISPHVVQTVRGNPVPEIQREG
jgi:pilus assembly protein CpaC